MKDQFCIEWRIFCTIMTENKISCSLFFLEHHLFLSPKKCTGRLKTNYSKEFQLLQMLFSVVLNRLQQTSLATLFLLALWSVIHISVVQQFMTALSQLTRYKFVWEVFNLPTLIFQQVVSISNEFSKSRTLHILLIVSYLKFWKTRQRRIWFRW